MVIRESMNLHDLPVGKPNINFGIEDILGDNVGRKRPSESTSIVRPWANCSSVVTSVERGERRCSSRPESGRKTTSQVSPLDALFKLTSKTFDKTKAIPINQDMANIDTMTVMSRTTPAKKRRKSRTAFTNQQIFELEKRFIYQKYLTPTDRDDIALSLGLSNSQVITWFQNRRAKLKRDLEELKADVTAASILNKDS